MTRVENAAPASTHAGALEHGRDAKSCDFSLVHSSAVRGELGTPQVIFYSDAVDRVYRRQRDCIAARLGTDNRTRLIQGDAEMKCRAKVCTLRWRRHCWRLPTLLRPMPRGGLSGAAGQDHRSLRRRRAGRRHRAPDRQHLAGKLRPALRGREPHRRRRRDRHAGSRQVAAGRLHAADDVEHPDRERIAGAGSANTI